ncbi:preprotein translocase subunit SecE [Fonticella tunisiensis]|uniref:Protein translocase subunit SecE n=1 Tax=Fonticella tunisiensis TaxID=1096341 RepID=A0A4R7K4A5_9CLOT|nr:preprotein translocase subunit SecE [Fonticella tunisiensis]TDT46015.1 preprotein translocase subunit SecE [Fonticella tunisiensis]
MAAQTKVGNVLGANPVVKFFRELKAEFKKITWPPKEEVSNTTGVVLSTVAFFTLVLWLFDSVFGYILRTVIKYIK